MFKLRRSYQRRSNRKTIMMLQLDPTIYVDTPLGRGHAIFLIDYGMHQNSCWVVTMEKNGIVKHFDANDIIVCTNFTYHINEERNCFKKNSHS